MRKIVAVVAFAAISLLASCSTDTNLVRKDSGTCVERHRNTIFGVPVLTEEVVSHGCPEGK